MKFEEHIPSAILKPFIKAFVVIECMDETINKTLPDTSIVMSFRYRGQVNALHSDVVNALPVAGLSGIRRSPRLFQYTGNTANFLVLFKEGKAAAFFKEPLNDFFEQNLALDDIVQRSCISIIEEQLAEATSDLDRVAIVEQFLISRLREAKPDLLVQHAIQKIRTAKGDLRIHALLSEFPVSRDPFEKRFRLATGTSPKQFAAIVRLRNIIAQFSAKKNLTDAAYDAGYFDQSHFIKSFKTFTGETPHDFFRSGRYW